MKFIQRNEKLLRTESCNFTDITKDAHAIIYKYRKRLQPFFVTHNATKNFVTSYNKFYFVLDVHEIF